MDSVCGISISRRLRIELRKLSKESMLFNSIGNSSFAASAALCPKAVCNKTTQMLQ